MQVAIPKRLAVILALAVGALVPLAAGCSALPGTKPHGVQDISGTEIGTSGIERRGTVKSVSFTTDGKQCSFELVDSSGHPDPLSGQRYPVTASKGINQLCVRNAKPALYRVGHGDLHVGYQTKTQVTQMDSRPANAGCDVWFKATDLPWVGEETSTPYIPRWDDCQHAEGKTSTGYVWRDSRW